MQTFQIWKSGTLHYTHIKEFKWYNHIIRTLWLFLRFFSPNLKWRVTHNRLSIIRGYFGNLKKFVRTLLRVAFDLLHSHLTVRSSSHLGESFWDPLPSFFKRLCTFFFIYKTYFYINNTILYKRLQFRIGSGPSGWSFAEWPNESSFFIVPIVLPSLVTDQHHCQCT